MTNSEPIQSNDNFNGSKLSVEIKNPKKKYAYWDPLYNPTKGDTYEDFASDSKGICGVYGKQVLPIFSESWKKGHDSPGKRISITDFKFNDCVFKGKFENLNFKGCTFILCDIGCVWENIKFNNCTFKQSSLTMAVFENCQFIDCKWENIGLSGNETKFKQTLINNPYEFIISAYTNTDPSVLDQKSTSVEYQLMRLEKTKASVARSILKNLGDVGDDESYYQGIKAYLKQVISHKETETIYYIKSKNKRLKRYLKIPTIYIEKILINIAGFINGWGGNIGRVAISGLIVIAIFSLIYWISGIKKDYTSALITSFDITFLAGYTKHSGLECTNAEQVIYIVNLVLGLTWYAIFFPTIINRISKSR